MSLDPLSHLDPITLSESDLLKVTCTIDGKPIVVDRDDIDQVDLFTLSVPADQIRAEGG